MKVILSRWYQARDYRGNLLSGKFQPFERDGKFFVCRNEIGGHVWIKGSEFVAEVR